MADEQDLTCCDYEALTCIWKKQLEQKGWIRTWDPDIDGPAFCERPGSSAMDLYSAWAAATNTPKDFNRK
jgi:hypothetical protein